MCSVVRALAWCAHIPGLLPRTGHGGGAEVISKWHFLKDFHDRKTGLTRLSWNFNKIPVQLQSGHFRLLVFCRILTQLLDITNFLRWSHCVGQVASNSLFLLQPCRCWDCRFVPPVPRTQSSGGEVTVLTIGLVWTEPHAVTVFQDFCEFCRMIVLEEHLLSLLLGPMQPRLAQNSLSCCIVLSVKLASWTTMISQKHLFIEHMYQNHICKNFLFGCYVNGHLKNTYIIQYSGLARWLSG